MQTSMRGGDSFDRVIANEHTVYVKMYKDGRYVWALTIITDNDVTHVKYVAGGLSIFLPSSSFSIGDSVHIVIENVTKNMGTELSDAKMNKEYTTILIDDSYYIYSCGTWTSTILPDNETVELNCEVVEVNGYAVTTKCITNTIWPNSVFNRIPMVISGTAQFGYNSWTNRLLFGTDSFKIDGSIPSS